MLNSLKMEKSGSKCLVLFKRIKYFPINYEQIGDLTVKLIDLFHIEHPKYVV